jgi:hypothetical protein
MLVGDVISATVPWVKENPVIAPQVLRLTSAVACCHVGFLTGITDSPSSPDYLLSRMYRSTGRRGYPALVKVCRIACTWALPGFVAFW